MTRLAADRETHLTPAEIAEEALRQFDQREREPSIRSLAAALRVAPAAIYHHFPSRTAIYQAAVELVWAEAAAELFRLVPKPLEAEPADVLVAAGLSTRRVWLTHYRVAPYMAATPEANEFVANSLGLMATVFERLELEGDDAAACFHSYASFMIGTVLFAAERKAANEQLERHSGAGGDDRFHTAHTPAAQRRSSKDTRISIDEVMDLSVVDPAHDEELFERGIRRLVESFLARVRD
jgi:AcrR family transcriptional regulator